MFIYVTKLHDSHNRKASEKIKKPQVKTLRLVLLGLLFELLTL